MKPIQTVGVVGAGTMGSALAQKFAQSGFSVVLADREMKFVEKGLAGIRQTLQEGVARRLFTEEQTGEIISRIQGTEQLEDLRECQIVIEAIFENFEAKSDLFRQLSGIVPSDTILATNTSSFSVSELAASVAHPQRFIGLHYFYHAAKNRLVEIIPGEQTSGETLQAARVFCALSGKDAITCKDRYGFAVNRFFVPWLNESVRLLEEGVADTAAIDQVCMRTFKIGMGPFALMNATGVPIAYHSQKTLERFGDFYTVAKRLKAQAEANRDWEIGESADISETAETAIRERMLGTVFLVCSQILDEGVCSAAELNRGARIGLRWRKGPVEMMQAAGEAEVGRLVSQLAERYKVAVPRSIGDQFWKLEWVELHKKGNLAVLRLNRPEDMNALNETVMRQLADKFEAAENDPEVETILITGSGKAFVAGADIKFFIDNIKKNTLDNIVAFTEFGQTVYQRIDASPKKVVAMLNGLALGGGLELALCADVILAVPEAVLAFPETGIGIYPGLGGTQRTREKIGAGLTKYLIYTGQMLNAKKAREIGLVDAIIKREDIFALAEGLKPIPVSGEQPRQPDARWQAIADFFDQHTIEQIFSGEISASDLGVEEVEKLRKKIGQKAPIALRIAEKLIDAAAGPRSELEELVTIFSTEDALLGLSSIGKRVEFRGK